MYEDVIVTGVSVDDGVPYYYLQNSFKDQLIGHTDPTALVGYQLYLDDGLGGAFHLEFDGTKQQRMTNGTMVENLFPGRTYRAYVLGVSWVGAGDPGEILSFPLVLPPA